MKVVIDGHRVIFSYLYLGDDMPDEITSYDGVRYSRISQILGDEGKLVSKRSHGYRVGVIIALDDGRMGYSVMDRADFFAKPSLQSVDRKEAFRRAYENASRSPEDAAKHPIPAKFKKNWDTMKERSSRYFGKGTIPDDPDTWYPITNQVEISL